MPTPYKLSLGLISVGSPLYFGIYKDCTLIAHTSSSELPLIALPKVCELLLKPFCLELLHAHGWEIENLDCMCGSGVEAQILSLPLMIENIYYARGPGSFTSLKLTHIFLHTLALLHDIKLYGGSSFLFASLPYIKAFGSMYFCYTHNGEISLCKAIDIPAEHKMIIDHGLHLALPMKLDRCAFSTETTPLYILPAVQ